MKKATISEAKNKLSQLIDWVKGGETVIITDRDIPVASLGPIGQGSPPGTSGEEGRLERLARLGLVSRPTRVISPDFWKQRPPKPKPGGDILEALLKEREEGW